MQVDKQDAGRWVLIVIMSLFLYHLYMAPPTVNFYDSSHPSEAICTHFSGTCMQVKLVRMRKTYGRHHYIIK